MAISRSTCIILLASVLVVSALHEHYKHLDLEYVVKETRRLTFMEKEGIFDKVTNNRRVVEIISERYSNLYETAESKESADA
jgi:hypothetical protein